MSLSVSIENYMAKNIVKKNIRSGIVIIACGLYIIFSEPFYSRGFQIHNGVGVVICLFGFLMILTSILGRKSSQEYQLAKMVCSECREEYYKSDVLVPICPKCNGSLIDTELNNHNEKKT